MFAKKEDQPVQTSVVKTDDFGRSTTQIEDDPNVGGFLQVFLNEETEVGANWVFGGSFNSQVYKRVDAQGNEHIATVKSNMDDQVFIGPFALGPSQVIVNNDYLSLASTVQIDPFHFVGTFSDEIVFRDDYIIV